MKDELLKDEMMTDEELDQVVGGTRAETSDDSKFLNVLLHGKPGQCDRYGVTRVALENHDGEITTAWAAVGVVAEIHSGGAFRYGDPNRYWIDNKEVSRSKAWAHAQKVIGRTLTRDQWDW